MEWLRHSNRSTEECDICNTQYRFRTIYDENMPKSIPWSYTWNRLVGLALWLAKLALAVLLHIVCLLIQVPLFWKLLGRLNTYLVDGRLPNPSVSLLSLLLYGDLTVSDNWTEHRAWNFLCYTYLAGAGYVVVFGFVLLVMYVEHEWVVHDDGFLRLLLRNVGDEPRTKLVDMLQHALNGLRNDGANGNADANDDLQRVHELARAINDLQESRHQRNDQDALREAINNEYPQHEAQHEHEHEHHDHDHDHDHLDELHDHFHDDPVHDDDADDFPEIANDNLLQVLGINLNMTMPLLLMALCDLVIGAFHFIFYFLPLLCGNVCIMVVFDVAAFTIVPLTKKAFGYLPTIPFTDDHSELITLWNTIHQNIVVPGALVVDELAIKAGLVAYSEPRQSLLMARALVLAVGYLIQGYVLRRIMDALVAGKKPIMGSARTVYLFLFECVLTFKVFAVFAIEIIVFPVYCGWLLDFCATPLFFSSFKTDDNTYTLLFSSSVELLTVPWIRVATYWAAGTLYMLLFALFVGMIRGHVLRPGVLYFIRSPDNANVRLIHDALVKSFLLQLSRIYLSGKVYTAFIVAGIGGVTWGLRWFVTGSDGSNVLLPLQNNALLTMVVSTCFHPGDVALVVKYVRKYWTRVFEILCHKLRLSHFILGTPVPQERGRIVYRSVWHQLFPTQHPDYTKPVSYKQALAIFAEHTDVVACFVPDGSFVRAPGHDTVTRKYIKKLFVPVTKDDKLISATEPTSDEAADSDSSDDEEIIENAYTVVYRPPDFQKRCLTLVVMLWVFAVILFVLITVSALLIGRVPSMLLSHLPFLGVIDSDSLQPHPLDGRLGDFGSLAFGLLFHLRVLRAVDGRPESAEEPRNEVEAEPRPNVFQELVNFVRERTSPATITRAVFIPLWAKYAFFIHANFVTPSVAEFTKSVVATVAANVVVFGWTLVPLLINLTMEPLGANYTWMKLFNASGGFTMAIDFVLAWGYQIWSAWYVQSSGITPEEFQLEDLECRFMVVAALTVLKTLEGLYNLWKHLEEKIRNERYVTGRALENIDLSDEERD